MIEIKYTRAKNAELYASQLPPKTTLQFAPNQPRIVGVGESPAKTLALTLGGKQMTADAGEGREFAWNQSRYIWVHRSGRNSYALDFYSHEELGRQSRLLLVEPAREAALHAYTENYAIDAALTRLELASDSFAVRRRAQQLLSRRDEVVAEIQKIDADLAQELSKARAAGRSAAIAGIVADGLQVAGAAMSAKNSSQPSADSQQRRSPPTPGATTITVTRTTELKAQQGRWQQLTRDVDVFFRQNGVTLEHYHFRGTVPMK
ncbi:hypothetical protein ACFIOY_29855 [Bradyrhizobium sp. TZ2]